MLLKELYEDMDLCLKMEGLTPSPRPLEELGARRGLTLTKRLMRGSTNFRLVNPKSYVVKDYVAQNPSLKGLKVFLGN